jgi:hypothetical protein
MLITVKLYSRFWQRFSFTPPMKYWLLFLFVFLGGGAFAQQDSLQGIVFDKLTKVRVAEVNILNATSGKSSYNSLTGEFTIAARIGDIIIFTKPNFYKPDTIKVQSVASLAIYLKSTGRMLQQVNVRDTILTPEQQLENTKRDYNKIYGPLGDKDLLSVGPDGAGLSIDALYNLISRSGRNAAHLRDLIQQDYNQNVIDYRFSRSLVARVTGLKDKQLTDFMQKYRPGYYFVKSATDYEFISSIKANYKRYLRRPNAYALPKLTP